MAEWIHTIEEGENLPQNLVKAYMLAVLCHIMKSENEWSPFNEGVDKAFWVVSGIIDKSK